MKVKFVYSTLVILLATTTFFAVDTISDTESTSGHTKFLIGGIVTILLAVGLACLSRLSTREERAFLKEYSHQLSSLLRLMTRKERAFLKEYSHQLSSEDPKVLLQLSEKCNEYLNDQGSYRVNSLLLEIEDKREYIFLKEHSNQLSSEDPKVLLELVEKCNEYRESRNIPEISNLARQAKDKATNIQQSEEERERIQREQANLDTFKSEISEDGSHPAVVAKLKETMHNPDSFQHVSSDYEIVEQERKRYQKIVMTFRGTNTFNALVLQTCYFIVDADNQIALVGFPDDTESSTIVTESNPIVTESSPVNTASLSESVDAAAAAVDGIATAADLLSFFISDE